MDVNQLLLGEFYWPIFQKRDRMADKIMQYTLNAETWVAGPLAHWDKDGLYGGRTIERIVEEQCRIS